MKGRNDQYKGSEQGNAKFSHLLYHRVHITMILGRCLAVPSEKSTWLQITPLTLTLAGEVGIAGKTVPLCFKEG